MGEATEAAEIPPVPTSTQFQCSEGLIAEKVECKDCGNLNQHNTRLWAERHVQLTFHRVEISLYFDMRDDDCLENMTRNAGPNWTRCGTATWRAVWRSNFELV